MEALWLTQTHRPRVPVELSTCESGDALRISAIRSSSTVRTIRSMLLFTAICLGALGRGAGTNAATGPLPSISKWTRVWISAFPSGQSVTVSTEHRDFPFLDVPLTPEIPETQARHWRTNYAVFGEALVSAAKKAQLDTVPLTKILALMLKERGARVACVPVEAHWAEVHGKAAWIVWLRWEYVEGVSRSGQIIHFEYAAYTPSMELLEGASCD